MTAPKQPNLTTDEKKIIGDLLYQERYRLRDKIQNYTKDQTETNAIKFYHKHVTRSLNKVGNRQGYNKLSEDI